MEKSYHLKLGKVDRWYPCGSNYSNAWAWPAVGLVSYLFFICI